MVTSQAPQKSPSITLEKVLNHPLSKETAATSFLANYHQLQSSHATIYLTWWFFKLEDIRCFAEVQLALFHLLHKISYGGMVLNFGRVSCLDSR